jgi:hypothetical protein
MRSVANAVFVTLLSYVVRADLVYNILAPIHGLPELGVVTVWAATRCLSRASHIRSSQSSERTRFIVYNICPYEHAHIMISMYQRADNNNNNMLIML